MLIKLICDKSYDETQLSWLKLHVLLTSKLAVRGEGKLHNLLLVLVT